MRAIVLATSIIITVVSAAPAAAENEPPRYRPPVAAPVVDAFRPPSPAYGPGNRGLEYDTDVGDAVTASAAGEVSFAGVVAGGSWVTVAHADSVRTSYGPLATVTVRRGDRVAQGDRVGTAGDRLHIGARLGEAYLDPAVLFALGPRRVHLVPDGPDAAEHRDWSELRVDDGLPTMWGDTEDPGAAARAVSWLRDSAVDSLDTPVQRSVGAARAVMRWLTAGPCTPWDGVAAVIGADRKTEKRRVVVLVGGLGSSSTNAAIDDVDTAALGYASGDVVRFSYRGGRTPAHRTPNADLTGLPESTYSSADTDDDIATAGHRLALLLEDVVDRVPGVPVDVVAHSQGGIAARQALVELPAAALTHLGFVATVATPHGGAEVADLVGGVSAVPGSRLPLEAVRRAFGLGIDPDGKAIEQLRPGSDLLEGLDAAGIPSGVRALAIGARGDLIVPAMAARWPGAANTTVGVGGLNDHARVPGADPVTVELALARAGAPPRCRGLGDQVADTLVSDTIADLEDLGW